DPTRTVSWVVDDGSGSFNLSAAQTTTISIHVGPAMFLLASAAFTEEGETATLAPNVTLSDTNATTTLTSATVALTGGTFTGDQDTLSINGATSGTAGTS